MLSPGCNFSFWRTVENIILSLLNFYMKTFHSFVLKIDWLFLNNHPFTRPSNWKYIYVDVVQSRIMHTDFDLKLKLNSAFNLCA